jgi:hypothetical protein
LMFLDELGNSSRGGFGARTEGLNRIIGGVVNLK